jgi:hypothetical protein
MKEHIKYTYEAIDGTMFDDEEKCQAYEDALIAKDVTIRMYNAKLELLPNDCSGFDEAVYLNIQTEKDIEFIEHLCEIECVWSPWKEQTCRGKVITPKRKPGVHRYDNRTELWVNMTEELAEMQKVFEKIC